MTIEHQGEVDPSRRPSPVKASTGSTTPTRPKPALATWGPVRPASGRATCGPGSITIGVILLILGAGGGGGRGPGGLGAGGRAGRARDHRDAGPGRATRSADRRHRGPGPGHRGAGAAGGAAAGGHRPRRLDEREPRRRRGGRRRATRSCASTAATIAPLVEQQQAQVESSRLQLQQEESQRVLGRAPVGAPRSRRRPERHLDRRPGARPARAAAAGRPSQPCARPRAASQQARTNLARTTLTAPVQRRGPQSENGGARAARGSAVPGRDTGRQRRLLDPGRGPGRQGELDRDARRRRQEGATARVWQEVGESGPHRASGPGDPDAQRPRPGRTHGPSWSSRFTDPLRDQRRAPSRGDAERPAAVSRRAGPGRDRGRPARRMSYEIPRSALHRDGEVYLYGADDRLAVREVRGGLAPADHRARPRGLEDGEELIVSRLPTPIVGTLLRHAANAGPGDRGSADRRGRERVVSERAAAAAREARLPYEDEARASLCRRIWAAWTRPARWRGWPRTASRPTWRWPCWWSAA